MLASCGCARLALHHVQAGDDRPRLAIEAAEQWARDDDGTREDVHRAYAAAYAAYAAAADDAAYTAATAAREDTLRRCADIVREHYPSPPIVQVVSQKQTNAHGQDQEGDA